jgi:acetamidase/formamidase
MKLASLQPGEGLVLGQPLLASTPQTVRWGWLPNANPSACLTVASGETVTIDTVSHEGILPDQDRNPVGFLGNYRVTATDVLRDAKEIASSEIPWGPERGRHVVTGPIAVTGAAPGDVLRIDIVDLLPRACTVSAVL